jgi:antirestriction protein
MTRTRININAYIANLERYAAGTIIGAWFDMSETTAEEITAVIGEGETIILDYEAPDEMSISEFENITDLIEMAQKLEEIDEEILNAMLYHGYTLKEAIEKIEDGDYNIYEDCDDMADVAYKIIEDQGLLDGAPELAQRYFDYAGFGRDIEIDGCFYKTSTGYIEIIH